jgi:hypothetical protein
MTNPYSEQTPTIINKIKNSWVEYSHALYIVVVIIGIFYSGYESSELKLRITLIAILIYYIITLLFLGYFIHIYARKARYAEAINLAHLAVHKLRDTNMYLKDCLARRSRYEYAEFKNQIQKVLSILTESFTLVTGTKCRICLKFLGTKNNKELYVTTMCRDLTSEDQSEEKDSAEGTQHTVAKNSDFHSIMSLGRNYFLHNSINTDQLYENTSKRFYGNKLPYNSVLVLPIRFKDNDPNNPACNTDGGTVVGFVAIDSASRGAFFERYDVHLGAIVADSLFTTLILWKRVHMRNEPKRGEHKC